MQITSDEILENIDGLSFIKELFPTANDPDGRGEVRVLCCFHTETEPSLFFNIDNKLFHCKGCGTSGSAIDLLAKVTNKPRYVAAEAIVRQLNISPRNAINPSIVEEFNKNLKLNKPICDLLFKEKGFDRDDIIRHRYGWNPKLKRMVIPIRDENQYIINLRFYDLLKIYDPKKKFLNFKGHGKLRLTHIEKIEAAQKIYICEGELKADYMMKFGLVAVSASGGVGSWNDLWNSRFNGKDVVILFDIDEPGRIRAKGLAQRLMNRAKSVKVISLPLDIKKYPHGDTHDYFLKEKYTLQDFINLENSTLLYQKDITETTVDDSTVYETNLTSASKAQYYNKRVSVDVLVSAKDNEPYIIPKEIKISCSRAHEVCIACPIYQSKETDTWTLDNDEPEILELLDVSRKGQELKLKELLGIPLKCSSQKILVEDTYNVEEIRLIPQLNFYNSMSEQHTVTRAYSIGHGISTNAKYNIEARVTVTPDTQHATLLIYQSEPTIDNLDNFKLADEELNDLKKFQPTEWTTEELDKKLDSIYNDLSHNITKIYQRKMLHVTIDLVWHSALYITFDKDIVRGWLDVLVIGDSGQGKSEIALTLLEFYELGERVDLKGATEAGLKGGLQAEGKKWFLTWGVCPLNDRGIVILEEVKGCKPEVLQTLTDMRTTGKAEITKVLGKRITFARTRKLWISNQRSNRTVSTYNQGVLTVKELFGALEDVRRLDAAIVVSSGEVPVEVINKSKDKIEPVEHIYDKKSCQNLILWGWSRQVDDVVFTEDAKNLCLKLANEQSKKYSANLPLVEPADHRYKIARLAAALAVRTFSTDDNKKLIVRSCHVEWIVKNFLEVVYDGDVSGYHEYSKIQKAEASLEDIEVVIDSIKTFAHPNDVVKGLLRSEDLNITDLIDFTNTDRDVARTFLSLLVRKNCVKRMRQNYYKTSSFINFLKTIKIDKVKRTTKEDF